MQIIMTIASHRPFMSLLKVESLRKLMINLSKFIITKKLAIACFYGRVELNKNICLLSQSTNIVPKTYRNLWDYVIKYSLHKNDSITCLTLAKMSRICLDDSQRKLPFILILTYFIYEVDATSDAPCVVLASYN